MYTPHLRASFTYSIWLAEGVVDDVDNDSAWSQGAPDCRVRTIADYMPSVEGARAIKQENHVRCSRLALPFRYAMQCINYDDA